MESIPINDYAEYRCSDCPHCNECIGTKGDDNLPSMLTVIMCQLRYPFGRLAKK